MHLQKLTLCKVGGSLLDWERFPQKLLEVTNSLSSPTLLFIGGGETADLVRKWDQLYRIGEERSHHLAIDSLTLTARLVTEIVPETVLVQDLNELKTALKNKRLPILAPSIWIQNLAKHASLRLPHSWEITSDSIALWIAAELQINHLLLLKSVDFPENADWKTASVNGIIDSGFPIMLEKYRAQNRAIEISWCNLRSILTSQHPEITQLPSD